MALIESKQLIDNAGVRKMCGRALRTDGKPVTRLTLLRWRAGGGKMVTSVREPFPEPVEAPHVAGDLWDRQAVKRWISAQTFTIDGLGGPRRDV